MNFTGFVGQACAMAASGASAKTTITAARKTKRTMTPPLSKAGYHSRHEDRNDGIGRRWRILRRAARARWLRRELRRARLASSGDARARAAHRERSPREYPCSQGTRD